MTSSWRSLGVAVVMTAVLSCGERPTEVVIRVRAEGTVAGLLTSVRVRVQREGVPPGHERIFALGSGQPALPQDLAVVPSGDDVTTPILVTVTAYGLGDTILLTQQARVRFDPGHIALLEVPLTDLCQSAACTDGFCLADGSCHVPDMDTPRADDLAPPR